MTLKIEITDPERKLHRKASEEYISVVFRYDNGEVWEGWVPVEYRRTGLSVSRDPNSEHVYLEQVYEEMDSVHREAWLRDQENFWKNQHPKSGPTKEIFDVLAQGGWKCVNCDFPQNPNWARRTQELKEYGYTLATHANTTCEKCGKSKVSKLVLLKIPRVDGSGNGYETWSPKLRKRILAVLGNVDAFEGKKAQHLLPDHKFPEIRWDSETKTTNPDTMSDSEIRSKFQLLTNQRNQQKREVCRKCFQIGIRPSFLNIPFFYRGNELWDGSIPQKGKDAEAGCIGCPWYDIERWREELTKVLRSND